MREQRALKVLIVEDKEIFQQLLQRALVLQGFMCDVASNADDAEEKVSKTEYDAIVIDLHMPKRNGHDLAVHLLKLEQRPALIVYTGLVEPKLAKDLLTRGVDEVAFKRIDVIQLAGRVKQLATIRAARISQTAQFSTGSSTAPLSTALPVGQ